MPHVPLVFFVLLLAGSVQSRPTKQPREDEVTVIESSYVFEPNNYYRFRYELSDGTIRFEVGFVRHVNGQPFTIVAEGFYEYRTPDGRTVHVAYHADQNGIRILENYIK